MKLLESHFEIALETPDGITKLRKLILSLAMKGKLVPQDHNDQPASELLKEIAAEKKRLIESKLLKIGQITGESKSISKLKNIPPNWKWAKGDEVFFITKLAGFEYTEHIKLQDRGDIPVIRAQNVKPLELDLRNLKYIDLRTSKLLARCALTKKALLLTFIGAGIGDVALFDKPERWHLAPNVAKMELFENCDDKIDLKFINYYLLSNYGREEIFKHLKSTAQPSISMGTIRDIDYPIPPLAEQKRIVVKIDRLMSLCDKLESERNERDKKRLATHTAAINRLLTATDKTSFNTSWSFINKNFSALYSVPENVEDLKKAILQLAVMGKLVPQDPNDQPASELLKEIEEEKKKLIKEGKIKKQEPLPPVKAEEVPYNVPKEWESIRLGSFLNMINGRAFKPTDWSGVGIPIVRIQNLNRHDAPFNYCDEALVENRHVINNGTFLISWSGTPGTSFGAYIWNRGRAALNQHIFSCFQIAEVFYDRYLEISINSQLEALISQAHGAVGLQHVTKGKLERLILPLPPLAEQKRIVTKIDQLMELCIVLGQQIKDATAKQTAILDAVLAGL